MKQLKIGLLLLGIGVIILVLLNRYPLTYPTGKQVTALVMSNTLTQSLDGHRRYLTLEMGANEIFRLSVAPVQDCPVGSTVELEENESLLSSQKNYRFIRCTSKPQ
ncbi:hypothetical protein EK599_22685 [Vibrio sp. T187]|uniref:hypothetical protein n=1 Tax=Vibrio TaxID=662 RepID=UPI0010C9A599|nr:MULTISPECIES: hypothetical protein [Vibrio]MBW3698488.1 hypothetical protein [Vibrio sp. T187]